MADEQTNRALIPVLVTLMLLTGVCNTLLTKYQVCYPKSSGCEKLICVQDMICVRDCDTANPKHFEQPVLQTYALEIR